MKYDAVVLVSFGGPEGPDDVLPFLRNVVRGRGVPEERLMTVAEHYHHFGGVSPINEQCRALLAALRPSLDVPVYWGNRNWHPFLADTLTTMRDDGVTRALAFVTSAYGGYSSCRQYLDDIAAARALVGPDAPVVDKIRHYYDHPGFVEPLADGVRAALSALGDVESRRLVFTAHSVPTAMNATSGPTGGLYEAQLREAAGLVAGIAGEAEWDLVWQSRSGPPHVPWLGPDINDHLRRLAAEGVAGVVCCPVGFVSDHLEVVWDLDTEAAATAEKLGLRFIRSATAWDDRRFAATVRQLIAERVDGGAAPPDGVDGPTCCPRPARPQ